MTQSIAASRTNPVLSWIRLARISNLPTAWSNVLMGFWVANHSWQPVTNLFSLLVSSTCLYVSGMILNDAFDVETDRIHERNRPLTRGDISVRSAYIVGFVLMIFGIVAAGIASFSSSGVNLLPLFVSMLLALSVLSYDIFFKRKLFAPVLMGICRSLNVLLGASIVVGTGFLGFELNTWLIAGIVGIYVCGITVYASRESKSGFDTTRASGLIIIASAIACISAFAYFNGPEQTASFYGVQLFILVMAVGILWRLQRGMQTGSPKQIQYAVITCLFCIIFFDAIFVLLSPPHNPVAALLVACLILPTNVFGRFVKAT